MTTAGETPVFVPDIVVLFCQHCVRGDAEIIAATQKPEGFSVRAEMMPCSSKVEIPHVLKILETGIDGVEVVACPEGTCKSLAGSLRAEKRMAYARSLLEEIHMGAERLGMSRKTGLSGEDLTNLAGARAEAVRALGPNPMREGTKR